jgi:hypothetical protein
MGRITDVAIELAPVAEARILEMPFDFGTITQTMFWHPRPDSVRMRMPGAVQAEHQAKPRWRVLLDPAGHPFCITTVTPPAGPSALGPEDAVV